MARSSKRQRRLSDGYSFAGFRARETVLGVFGDPDVRVVSLDRRAKKQSAAAAAGSRRVGTTGGRGGFAICRAPGSGLSWNSKCVASRAAIAAP
jgi:hypothetical protein